MSGLTREHDGQTWKLVHVRKGPLTATIRILDDEWCELEILAGRVRYMSASNNFDQKVRGVGTPGDIITSRSSFINLIEQVAIPAPSEARS